ncbi:MAG: TonB-dependent receptor [Bacteroidota bacterium]
MSKRVSIQAILFTFFVFSAASQRVTIKGRVVANQQGIPFATIQVAETTKGVIADQNGYFELKQMPKNNITLLVSAIGYRPQQQEISPENAISTPLVIELVEDLLGLEEVVVSGTRYEYDRVNAPVIVNVLGSSLLNATQSIAISEGLNYQPGVRVETNCQNCGFTQVRLNGLEGAYSQILINSRPVFSALNNVYGLEQIPTNIVKQIEVVRGGGSALYGSNAIAGTINIITKEPIENTWEIQSNTALVAGEALDQTYTFNGSIIGEELSSGVTFYGMSRNRDSYDANGDGFTELVLLENNVLGAKAYLKPNDQSKISLDFSALTEYRRGGDRLDLAPHFTDITEELTHNTFFGNLNADLWNRDNQNMLSVYASFQNTARDSFYGGLGGGRTSEDSLLALNAYGLTDDFSLVYGSQFSRYFTNQDVLTIGIESQHYSTKDEIQGYNRLIDQQVNTVGLFGQYEWKPSRKLTTLLGARYDFTDVAGRYEIGSINRSLDTNIGVLSPRMTVLFKLSPSIRLRAGYARGFRAPQAFNEDLHISSVGGEPLFVILSDDLDKETSNAYTASINITKSSAFSQSSLLLEGFYTQLQNPFTQVSTGATLSNGSILEEVRNGEGVAVAGFNFEAGYAPNTQTSFQLGGTLQNSRYEDPQVLFDPEEGSSDTESLVSVNELVRNPNLYGYFTSAFDLFENFKFDLTGTYTGSMIVPRVVSENGFLDLIDSDPFFDMNLKASYRLSLSDDFDVVLSSGIKNLFDSFQPEFDRGAQRDSDFIYGPANPRSIFFSIKFGNLDR